MSLYGYKKKGKPANWLSAFPSACMKLIEASNRMKRAAEQPKRNWTTVPGASARKPARPASQRRLYLARARAFVAEAVRAGRTCPVVAAVPELREGRKYGWPISSRIVEVHHFAGRGHGGRGPLLMDERLWIALSKQGHRYVHENPAWAQASGFMAPAGRYNAAVPEGAVVERMGNGGLRVGNNLKKYVDTKD